MEMPRGYIACTLWVLALALMVYGTLDYSRDGTPAGFAWGVFVAAIASTVTTWANVDRCCHQRDDDMTVDEVAKVVDALHEAKRDVAHLISPRS